MEIDQFEARVIDDLKKEYTTDVFGKVVKKDSCYEIVCCDKSTDPYTFKTVYTPKWAGQIKYDGKKYDLSAAGRLDKHLGKRLDDIVKLEKELNLVKTRLRVGTFLYLAGLVASVLVFARILYHVL